MNKYRVSVVMSYWQTIIVDAENKEQAGQIAYDKWNESGLFDGLEPYRGDGEVHECNEIKGEGK